MIYYFNNLFHVAFIKPINIKQNLINNHKSNYIKLFV